MEERRQEALRKQEEAARLRKEQEAERLRKQQEAEAARKRAEQEAAAARLRAQQEAERQRQKAERQKARQLAQQREREAAAARYREAYQRWETEHALWEIQKNTTGGTLMVVGAATSVTGVLLLFGGLESGLGASTTKLPLVGVSLPIEPSVAVGASTGLAILGGFIAWIGFDTIMDGSMGLCSDEPYPPQGY